MKVGFVIKVLCREVHVWLKKLQGSQKLTRCFFPRVGFGKAVLSALHEAEFKESDGEACLQEALLKKDDKAI